MKNLKWIKVLILAATLTLGFSGVSYAEESMGEKAAEAGRDLKKNTKKAWRNAKDELCEMVNGKVECVKDKLIHKGQNAKDEVKDKVDAD